MTKIRRAELKDLPIVQKLGYQLLETERQGWDPTLDSSWAKGEGGRKMYLDAIENKYVVLAEDDGEVVGYLIGKVHFPDKQAARHIVIARLINIYVDETHRHQGVGKKLFDHFYEHCLEQGVEDLEVLVSAKNENAIEFYKKQSFTPKRIAMVQKLKQ